MKKVIITAMCLIVTVATFCKQGQMTWNVTKNIDDFIEVNNNAEIQHSKNLSSNIGIAKQCYGVQSDTELYLPFDENVDKDETGNYKAQYSDYLISDTLSMNRNSGYFLYNENKIELKGNKDSFFQPGENVSSFTFNYWIFPMTTAYNEEILRIGRQYYNKKYNEIHDQCIINRIENGHLVCDFNYVFIDGEKYIPNIRVESYSMVTPNKWNNIIMTFDSYTGVIRCYINGIEEGIGIANAGSHIDSDVYDLRFHPNNRCLIKICQAFTGLIDEFYIYRGVKSEYLDRYKESGAEVLSKVIRLDEFGGFISDISTIEYTPDNSQMRYFYRVSEEVFGYDVSEQKLPWILLANNEFDHKLVKYIQFKLDFLPGINNETTPLFRQLSITYEKNLLPVAPEGLKVQALDKSVRLKWTRNSELDVKGYKVYFGTKQSTYFGTGSTVSSPVIVDANEDFEHEGIIIDGLDNNIIYYFTVTAFDDNEATNESEFGKEVICRPGLLRDVTRR